MRRIIIFITAFVILSTLSFGLLKYDRDSKIEEHLQAKTTQYLQNYHTLYENQRMLSEVIFKTMIDMKEVKKRFKDASTSTGTKKDQIREMLYLHLKERYALLKKYKIRQLHFHLPNNESFLRFHRPEKYGDNLTDVRETVRYVNETRQGIDGFEEGRIYNGYRSVFPLFYEEKYIGSVEVSLSTLAMISEFMKNYNVIANFLILKEKVDEKVFECEHENYRASPFKNFYVEGDIVAMVQKTHNIKVRPQLSQETKDIVYTKGLVNGSFSIYDSKIKTIITFIKVDNPITEQTVGIFLVKSSAAYIFEKIKFFYIAFSVTVLFLVIMLFFIYKELNYRDKEKQLLQQSRLAQMGEMMSMIAHQWRQPLAAISATTNALILKNKRGKYESGLFDDRLHKIAGYSQHLSTTINDFRNFFQVHKEKEETSLEVIAEGVLRIIQISLENKNIKITTDFQCNIKFEAYANELKQVVLNLIKNAEDALLESQVINPEIIIRTFVEDDNTCLCIEDNGGGVDETIIKKVFDPYFSTKQEKDGTGLGLYMSKIIVEEHCNGVLSVSNNVDGAVFMIALASTLSK